jgi:hypothetical protein
MVWSTGGMCVGAGSMVRLPGLESLYPDDQLPLGKIFQCWWFVSVILATWEA